MASSSSTAGRRGSRERRGSDHHGGTSVEIRHAFGSQCQSNSMIDAQHAGFLDPNYAIAPVGLHIGIRNVQNKDEIYFLQQSKGIEAISAFCVSPDKTHVVSCELTAQEPNYGQISIYVSNLFYIILDKNIIDTDEYHFLFSLSCSSLLIKTEREN